MRRTSSGNWGWGRSSPPRRAALSGPRSRSRFGTTWWGQAWVEALEQGARLDPNRLPRGRTYARSGAVGALTIAPGEVCAQVQGSRSAPYSVHLRVRPFSEAEWKQALQAVAGKSAHLAALLDGELDPGVVAEMAEGGIDLLPVAGELGPKCSCPDWAEPCKHAAAVCYLVADCMDEDPFTILHLRGRTRAQVLAGVRQYRAAEAAATATATATAPSMAAPGGSATGQAVSGQDVGIVASVFFAQRREAVANPGTAAVARLAPATAAIAAAPARPEHPGRPAALAAEPPDDVAVRGVDLHDLAADAALRAWELCQGRGDGGLGLTVDEDLARLAANRVGDRDFDGFARRVGRKPRELMRAALAWRAGGAAALEVLNGAQWSPGAVAMDEGVVAMSEAFEGLANVRGERITYSRADLQLRYGRDGLWCLLVRKAGSWEIHDPPAADPRSLLRALAGLARSPKGRT